eukprot:COSAG05_NODE_650_length_8102_cov_16.263383_10_plen_35_part_00
MEEEGDILFGAPEISVDDVERDGMSVTALRSFST